MPVSFILFIFMISGTRKSMFIDIAYYDIIFLLFTLYAGLTVIGSLDPQSGLRLFLGATLIFFCYQVLKSYFLFKRFTPEKIERATYISFSIFLLASLALYFIGLLHGYTTGAEYSQDRIFYGVMLDRGIPRLIGLINDPNIFCFYAILPLFYLVFKKQKTPIDYIMLGVTILCVVLTYSRGGWLAILFSFFVFLLLKLITVALSLKIKTKSLMAVLSGIPIVAFIFYHLSSISFFKRIIEQRLSTAGSGSGRFEIWLNALEIWQNNPLFGIGWYNFLYYNDMLFQRHNYVHNTFLEVLVETGVVGFFLYMLMHFFIFYKLIKLVKNNSHFKYMFFSYIAMVLLMVSLSLIINEMFFLFLSLLSAYSKKYFIGQADNRELNLNT